ncbi:MAG: SCO family protein [bacterium]|nr:SCO family protein [bacterium]
MKMKMTKSLYIYMGVLYFLITGIGAAVMWTNKKDRPPSIPLSAQLVGGNYSLIDHTGKRVSNQNFHGKYQLVYFGYTYCPDVCPLSLNAISEAMEALGPLADEITPLFITVDPERDTVEQMASYVENFDKRTIGLTGTKQEVALAANAYKIFSEKVVDNDSKMVTYDHSSVIYLMDRQGKYLAQFAHGARSDKMAQKIRSLIKSLEPEKLTKLLARELVTNKNYKPKAGSNPK